MILAEGWPKEIIAPSLIAIRCNEFTLGKANFTGEFKLDAIKQITKQGY